MTNENYPIQEPEHRNGHGRSIFAGVVIGGLTGAITALLFAPQSGKETRAQIQSKVADARHQATAQVEGTVEQIRTKASEIRDEVGSKAKVLKAQGRDLLVEQLDRVSAAAEARKKDLQGNRS